MYTCNPSVGEAESGRSLELTGYPDWPNLVAEGGEGAIVMINLSCLLDEI